MERCLDGETAGTDSTSPLRVGAAIVGAQKCGTTTLAALLDEHPRVRLAIGKEAHLFDRPDVQRHGPSAHDIEHFWPGCSPEHLLLDATPSYLYLPGCLEALLGHSPDVRLIVVLRSPGERMVSHHLHERRLGVEQRSFLTALLAERRRLRRSVDPLAPDSAHRHASYRDRGRYAAQIGHLVSLTTRVHVVLFGDLIDDPERTMAGVHHFLGLEPRRIGSVPHLNRGDGRPHRIATAIARQVMRRDARDAERLLTLPPGSLT